MKDNRIIPCYLYSVCQLNEIVFSLARVRTVDFSGLLLQVGEGIHSPTPSLCDRRQISLPPAVRTGGSSANDQAGPLPCEECSLSFPRRIAPQVRQAESKAVCFLKLRFAFLPSTKRYASFFEYKTDLYILRFCIFLLNCLCIIASGKNSH